LGPFTQCLESRVETAALRISSVQEGLAVGILSIADRGTAPLRCYVLLA
jgi:hypothetical protein